MDDPEYCQVEVKITNSKGSQVYMFYKTKEPKWDAVERPLAYVPASGGFVGVSQSNIPQMIHLSFEPVFPDGSDSYYLMLTNKNERVDYVVQD